MTQRAITACTPGLGRRADTTINSLWSASWQTRAYFRILGNGSILQGVSEMFRWSEWPNAKRSRILCRNPRATPVGWLRASKHELLLRSIR